MTVETQNHYHAGSVEPTPELTLEEKVDSLLKSHNEILAMVAELMTKVEPMLEDISSGPIGKLLGIKNG